MVSMRWDESMSISSQVCRSCHSWEVSSFLCRPARTSNADRYVAFPVWAACPFWPSPFTLLNTERGEVESKGLGRISPLLLQTRVEDIMSARLVWVFLSSQCWDDGDDNDSKLFWKFSSLENTMAPTDCMAINAFHLSVSALN